MDKSEMILLKGEPKTFDILSINEDNKGVYWVRFKSGKSFPYANRDVCILKSPKEINVADCRISNRNGQNFYPSHIWEYRHYFHRYYRIEYPSGDLREYDGKHLVIKKSVLSDDNARRVFNYLKEVSGIQPIITENGPISLYNKYDKINFVDEDSVLGRFLRPTEQAVSKASAPLLYPFYSNLSQMQAVKNAFESQISIIQGPPGTGKTQTILNIVANIIAKKQTVLIVSNNNSAVENVKEKLDKEGLGFIVAELGKSDNRKVFIEHGQTGYPDMSSWKCDDYSQIIETVDTMSKELRSVFDKQNQLAKDEQELSAISIEQDHFYKENSYDEHRLDDLKTPSSEELTKLWVQLDIRNEEIDDTAIEEKSAVISLWMRIKSYFQDILFSDRLKRKVGKDIDKNSEDILLDIKALFYSVRKKEIEAEIDELTTYLADKHSDVLLKKQASISMQALKIILHNNYNGGIEKRQQFTSDDLRRNGDTVTSEYPVVLSTTYSAVSTLPGYVFDYIIMDEASQVPVESAALALSKANNAVIVGDLKQLPNIITEDVREKVEQLNSTYEIGDRYNCLSNSFLSSVTKVFPDAPTTLLREHYRCAPMIINFCNQKFYGGDLIIMTKADSDTIPMKVIKTVKGNHSRSIQRGDKAYVFNQREVDVFQKMMEDHKDISLASIGIITPYKGQALYFHNAIKDKRLEADTIHKYQGREKDIIVMSTVADKYNEFVDNSNLINVAVSRAKKEFILITNGNDDNPEESNIKDLIDYINYNHGDIIQSNLHSIFDLLYASYAEQRKKYLKGKGVISDYDSENIAYGVISTILKRNDSMANLEVLTHYHLSSLISDTSLLSEEEYKFVCASWSHVDFLIENRVSKLPVLAIEVDGFTYHHKGTRQAERDRIKDSIFNKYGIPLLRLSTTGSSEVDKIERNIASILQRDIK